MVLCFSLFAWQRSKGAGSVRRARALSGGAPGAGRILTESGPLVACESGPLRAVHLSRHKWSTLTHRYGVLAPSPAVRRELDGYGGSASSGFEAHPSEEARNLMKPNLSRGRPGDSPLQEGSSSSVNVSQVHPRPYIRLIDFCITQL